MLIFRRFLFLFLFYTSAGAIHAQRTSYGLFAGANTSTASYKVRDAKQATDYRKGVQGGLMIAIPFENRLTFTPNFYYTSKGYSVNLKDSAFPPGVDVVYNNVRLHVVEIAPLFKIDMSANPGHIYIQFGPAIDIAIKGTEELRFINDAELVRPMPFSFTTYGRFTSAAIFRIGYETAAGWQLFGQYTHGLGGQSNADGGPMIRHRVFGISIGKMFKRNPNVLDTRNKE